MIESINRENIDVFKKIEKRKEENINWKDDYDEFYIYNDLDLFLIILLLEFYKKGLTQVSFYQIIGYGLEKISDKIDYIHDYESYIHYILCNLENNFTENALNFFKVINYTIDTKDIYSNIVASSYSTIKSEIVHEDVKIEDVSLYYGEVISELNDLQNKYNFKREFGNYKFNIELGYNVISDICREAPKDFYINLDFAKKKVTKLEKDINTYLEDGDFGGDYPVSRSEFIEYITKLNLIKETVRVPFSILGTKDFDFIKTIKLMEFNKDIKIINLLSIDSGYWEIKIINKDILEYFPVSSFIKREVTKKVNILGTDSIYLVLDNKREKLTNYELKLSKYIFNNYAEGKKEFRWKELELEVYNQEKEGGSALKSVIEKIKKKAKKIGYKSKFITYSVGDYLVLELT